MKLSTMAVGLCVALTAADCSWDAGAHSDFITFGAGSAQATATVEQAQDIWPPDSLDNTFLFDSSRFLHGAAPKPQGKTELGQQTLEQQVGGQGGAQ